MRALLTATAVAFLCVPLAAAQIDPKSLVLRQADLPPGFRLDERTSGVRSNARESRGKPDVKRIIARSGRVTGYEAEFDRREATIESRADLFREPEGAQVLLEWFDREVRKSGVRLERSRARIGAGGWTYAGRSPAIFTLVVWRHDRVFAGVVATLLPKERAVALARVQQRRIAAALR